MSSDNLYRIRSSRKASNHVFDDISKPCVYSPINFGLPVSLKGSGVKIAIIDTGMPDHSDISNIFDGVDMSDSSKGSLDTHGHATMVAGIIGSKNRKTVTGIATEADLLFAKVANSSGKCSFNAVSTSVLWSIVKNVDIILISLASGYDFQLLHDAVKKANQNNICVIAASEGTADNVEYPAGYEEVIAIGRSARGKTRQFKSVGSNGVKIMFPDTNMYTTYLHNRYTKASGSSLTAALAAGVSVLLIEKAKQTTGSRLTPSEIKNQLASLSYCP